MIKFLKVSAMIIGFVLIGLIVQNVTQNKFLKLKDQLGLGDQKVVTAKERERQLDCLAINIYREAGHESFEGKVGVAQVTLNRTSHEEFPNDVCAVVYQKNKFVEKVVCQFSWYCDSTHRNRPINKDAYNESYEVAKKVLLENFRLPSLTEALYYHADYVNPQWPHTKLVKIGRHIFYKPKKEQV